MKINFQNQLEAIDWIATFAEDEGQFEVLREQLMYNYLHTGTHFLEITDEIPEVVLLDQKKK